MSQNLRKKAARGSKRQSDAAVFATIINNNTPSSSRHTTSEEEAWSETSGDTVDSWASFGSHVQEQEPVVNWEDQVLQCVEDLGEKRTSLREEALTRLIRLLSRRYTADILNPRRETLLDLLNRSIKKDKSYKENRLSAKVMSLLFITLGESQETMYRDVLALLTYTIKNTASLEVKCACIKTLALACFIAAPQEEALDLLDFLANIISTNGKSINAINDGATLTNALNAYGLLYAGLWGENNGNPTRARAEFERIIPSHVKQLQSTSVEVRVASGENIALMFETLGIGKKVDPTDEWYNNDEESDDADANYDDIDQLTELLNMLATDGNKRRNKADRKIQRSVFRDVLRTVEDGDGIKEKLKFKKQTIYFSSWAKIMELNAFRDSLAEGLHVHFEENHLLQSLFEFMPSPNLIPNNVKGSRPGSAMSFYNAGSDTDTSISKRKAKNKKIRKSNRRGEFLEVG